MKKVILALLVVAFMGCGKNKKFAQDASSLAAAKEELIDEFGKEAYYTDIYIIDSEHGPTITVTTTQDPSSLKMGTWTYFQGNWKQVSEVTLELEGDDIKSEDFMFQLDNGIVDFALLGKLVEQSKEKLTKEKNIEVVTDGVLLKVPMNGGVEGMTYLITHKPKSGGTSFTFRYKMDGTLESSDY